MLVGGLSTSINFLLIILFISLLNSSTNSLPSYLLSFIACYNLRLGSGCNLGKDLRKDRDKVQLVKCKEYRVVSMLYIQIVHETSIWST